MSELAKIIILSIVQGVTEFLPISSSGHLAVIGRLINIETANATELTVVLHAGTLLAIVIFYFKQLLWLLTPEGMRLIPKIILATIPVGLAGVALHASGLDDTLFSNLLVPGVGFFITGSFLLFFSRGHEDKIELGKISFKDSVLVGLAQAVAILPGVSRSGSTISTALKLGVKNTDAATFSFLLAIPAILGATVVKVASKIMKNEVDFGSEHFLNLGTGFAVSALVGYFSLCLLLATIKKGKLSIFAYYCFILGSAVILWGICDIFN